jgi:hypothetical protein
MIDCRASARRVYGPIAPSMTLHCDPRRPFTSGERFFITPAAVNRGQRVEARLLLVVGEKVS